MEKKDIFLNLRKIYNKGYLYNFVVGARGCGKTFGIKECTTDDFLETGEQFVYCRRYESEIEPKKIKNFYDDLWKEKKDKYKNVEFEVKGDTSYINGEAAGYFKAVSRGIVDKGINTYTDVGKIFLDEFILGKSTYHYLPNEPEMFEDIIENISRLREVPVYCFSNNVSQVNPYFLFYGIRFTPNSPNVYRKGDIYAVNLDMKEYSEFKANTRRGQVLKGTKYFEYAFENTARLDNKTNIRKKTPKSRLLASITINSYTIGVWKSQTYGEYTLSPDHQGAIINYAFDLNEVGCGQAFLNYKSIVIKRLMESFANGKLYFENQTCKNLFLKIVRR